jgi:hypothetical protein
MILGRQIFTLSADPYSAENTFYYVFTWLGNLVIWLVEAVATLIVMGGASKNFVRHLLFGEAITFRETYRNTWNRLGGLFLASTIITIILGSIGIGIFYLAALLVGLALLAVMWAIGAVPVLAFLVSLAVSIAMVGAALWAFCFVASRLAYVPQVMLVEGQGVFSAIGRSASLATGSVRRLAALFVFTTVAAYSALALLYVPLAWYASANGVEIMSFDPDVIPAWYEIAYNVIWQVSFILLSPVWTIGLCLLYVDERVRSEGYDIELMAARRLGEIPDLPTSYVSPLQPALAGPPDQGRHITTLGLK